MVMFQWFLQEHKGNEMVLFSNTCMLRQFLKIQFNDTSGLEMLSCNVQETCKFLVKIKLSMC